MDEGSGYLALDCIRAHLYYTDILLQCRIDDPADNEKC